MIGRCWAMPTAVIDRGHREDDVEQDDLDDRRGQCRFLGLAVRPPRRPRSDGGSRMVPLASRKTPPAISTTSRHDKTYSPMVMSGAVRPMIQAIAVNSPIRMHARRAPRPMRRARRCWCFGQPAGDDRQEDDVVMPRHDLERGQGEQTGPRLRLLPAVRQCPNPSCPPLRRRGGSWSGRSHGRKRKGRKRHDG